MKNLALILMLTGCGGSPFTARLDEADGGSTGGAMTISTGGAPMVGTGGKVGGGSGGVDSGLGGASAGGSESAGGSSGSTGGVVAVGGQGSGGTAGTGGSAGCKPGATRCQSATAVQTCDASGSWGMATLCAGAYTGGLEWCCSEDSCGVRSPAQCNTVGCTPVTHDNGIGQTWQDCSPLGTYDESQAMKACDASGAITCTASTRCGPSVHEVQGFDANGYLVAEWGYSDFAIGLVSLDYNLCSSPDPGRRQWR